MKMANTNFGWKFVDDIMETIVHGEMVARHLLLYVEDCRLVFDLLLLEAKC